MSFLKRCHSLFPQKFKSIHLKTSHLQFNPFYIIKSNLWLTCFNYHSPRDPKSQTVRPVPGLQYSGATLPVAKWRILFQCTSARSIFKFLGFKCSNCFIGQCCVWRFCFVLKDQVALQRQQTFFCRRVCSVYTLFHLYLKTQWILIQI